ncbi:hypothetical protein Cgig2_001950 [Carnegiea gigantea]|uniref:Uncharacterized protein n=1 Tax=Carnegiea gigantea TaxID=171969 RepID=A0A9Q1K1M3_9CARY|nr:hypothetical protein Cgig2_001950 [Carnegiea gigantea]
MWVSDPSIPETIQDAQASLWRGVHEPGNGVHWGQREVFNVGPKPKSRHARIGSGAFMHSDTNRHRLRRRNTLDNKQRIGQRVRQGPTVNDMRSMFWVAKFVSKEELGNESGIEEIDEEDEKRMCNCAWCQVKDGISLKKKGSKDVVIDGGGWGKEVADNKGTVGEVGIRVEIDCLEG